MLEAVFHENWSVLLARIESVEETDEPAADQLRHVTAIVLRTWLHLPDVVRVVVREFGRSPEVAERIGVLAQPIYRDRAGDRARHRAGRVSPGHRPALRGDRRLRRRSTSCSPRGCSDRLPAGEADVAAAEQTLLEISFLGLQAAVATSSANRAAPTLPPERTTPTERSRASTFPLRSAATPTAPLGSATSFSRSKRKTIAATISSSVTVTISSTQPAVDLERQLAGLGRLQPVGDRRAGRRCARARRRRATAACRRRSPARRRPRGSRAAAPSRRSRSRRSGRRR